MRQKLPIKVKDKFTAAYCVYLIFVLAPLLLLPLDRTGILSGSLSSWAILCWPLFVGGGALLVNQSSKEEERRLIVGALFPGTYHWVYVGSFTFFWLAYFFGLITVSTMALWMVHPRSRYGVAGLFDLTVIVLFFLSTVLSFLTCAICLIRVGCFRLRKRKEHHL